MKKKAAKKLTQMEELTKNYEKFIADKELNENGRELFEQVLKKAAKTKPRGSK